MTSRTKPSSAKKRIAAVLVAVTMVLGLSNISAFSAYADVDPAPADPAPTDPAPAGCAQVGDATFDTLLDAFSAAEAGQTITLLQDYALPHNTNTYTEYNLPDNAVLDLNGKTLTTRFTNHAFQGKNATIKNGTISANADYALWIGNDTQPTSITLQNIRANGGINVYAARALLDNCTIDAASRTYYALWADNGNAKITVLSGSYTGGKGGVVHTSVGNNSDGTFTPGEIELRGGVFDGKLNSGGKLTISGGTFTNTADIQKYLAPNTGLVDGVVHGHSAISIPAVEPTCTAPGKTAGSQCGICKEFIVEPQAVKPQGHNFNWEVVVKPTQETEGSMVKVCARCGAHGESAVIEKLPATSKPAPAPAPGDGSGSGSASGAGSGSGSAAGSSPAPSAPSATAPAPSPEASFGAGNGGANSGTQGALSNAATQVEAQAQPQAQDDGTPVQVADESGTPEVADSGDAAQPAAQGEGYSGRAADNERSITQETTIPDDHNPLANLQRLNDPSIFAILGGALAISLCGILLILRRMHKD